MGTAATPPCFGYHTRLLLQAVADSRLTLHPANPAARFRLEQMHKIQRPSPTCILLNYNKNSSTSPLQHLFTSPLILSTTTTCNTSQSMFAIRPLQNKGYKHSNAFDSTRDKHIPVPPSSPYNSYKPKHPPIPNCFYSHALGAFPITLISDPPSCHSTCLILQGLQTQAFFRVLDCLCAELGRELHLLRL